VGSTLVLLLFAVLATAIVLVAAVLGALLLLATPLSLPGPISRWKQRSAKSRAADTDRQRV